MTTQNGISPIQRISPAKKNLGLESRIGLKGAYRQLYAGTQSSDSGELKVDPVAKSTPTLKYSDNAGVMGKSIDRVSHYKDAYRKYYALEQALEEHFDQPREEMDFVDHLYAVLTDINLVLEALTAFDKAFDTAYLFQVGSLIRQFEDNLVNSTVLIHVDYTLGFFKGRMKKAYEAHPEAFDFYVESETGFIENMIRTFRLIKAVIPERIDEISTRLDRNGAIIDQKL